MNELEKLPLLALLLLAFGCRITSWPIERIRYPAIPPIAGGAFLVAYFLGYVARGPNGVLYILLSFIRSVAAYEIVRSVLVLALAGEAVVNDRLQRARRIREWEEGRRLREEDAERRKPEPLPEPPPPIPRSERLQTAAADAQEAYEQELKVLEGMPLDADEREVLGMRAKQRLLERIKALSVT